MPKFIQYIHRQKESKDKNSPKGHMEEEFEPGEVLFSVFHKKPFLPDHS
jgi:hypothetical protein